MRLPKQPLLPVEDGLGLIWEHISPLPVESISLANCLGRVLADDFVARADLPSFPRSAMDGFALRAADIQGASEASPVKLRVVGDVRAGAQHTGIIEPGSAVRIMTGAPVPAGVDAVLPVELVSQEGGGEGGQMPQSIAALQAVPPGAYIREPGLDVRAGQRLLEAGHRIRTQDLGMLSALGAVQIDVHKIPQVGLFSTGDELVPLGEALRPGMIYDSNTPMLASSVQAAGGNVLVAEMLADDPSAIRDFLDQTVESGATLLLSSAGVSVGAFDLVRDVLEEFGHLIFWRVNMRPGKPLAFGLYRNVPFLALPGNPVSAFVSFEVFGKTALARLSGQRHVQRTRLTARLAQEIESDGRESYLRVSVQRRDGEYWATLAGDQDSSVMSTLLQANGLLVMPAGVRRLPAGESTLVWLLDTTIVDAGT